MCNKEWLQIPSGCSIRWITDKKILIDKGSCLLQIIRAAERWQLQTLLHSCETQQLTQTTVFQRALDGAVASPAVPSTNLPFPCRISIRYGPTSRSRRLPGTLLDSAAPSGASPKLRPSSYRPLGHARSLFACRHRGGHANDDTFRRSLQSLCGFLR